MAAGWKPRFAKRLKQRLNVLGCPYEEGADESWIIDLVFKPGEPRIRLLQWLFSKYDMNLGEIVNSVQTTFGSGSDSRLQRLLFVASTLGLCRYDDVDLIRGADATDSSSMSKQAAFIDQLLDVVVIHDAAEDPLTKYLLSPGIISESSPLEDQVSADSRYMDVVAGSKLPIAMLTATVDLIPQDIRRDIRYSDKDSASDLPTLLTLTEMCNAVEKSVSRRLQSLKELEEPVVYLIILKRSNPSANELQRAGQSLDLILGELCQLELSFTYCFENEMLPWCDRSPPVLTQLGTTLKRVHTLTENFVQVLQGLQKIHNSYTHLSEGVTEKMKTAGNAHSDALDTSQAVASSFLECVDILEGAVGNKPASYSSSLCSTTLKL